MFYSIKAEYSDDKRRSFFKLEKVASTYCKNVNAKKQSSVARPTMTAQPVEPTLHASLALDSLADCGVLVDLFLSPPQPHLAVGSNDYYMSIYSAEKRLR